MRSQRILFVDDEPMLLQGLQRMLRTMRTEWDMMFVDSAEKALQAMTERPFDVVVSDMRMPGMNGAELLKEVMEKYPTTVRLVLSGHADRNLVAQCVGVAHQYLSKPCDPEQLKSMVRNACILANQMVSGEVRKVLGSIDRLPTVPAVYQELTEALRREETSTQALGSIIQKDPGMTAKILKLVNSAFFGLRRTIASPQEAVAYLGMDTTRTLVLADGIFDQAIPFETTVFGLEDLWHHSMSVAAGAKAIARAEGLGRELQEEAFVGGILHDIGMLILASNFPGIYDQAAQLVLSERILIPTAEKELFGVTHAEVGAYLLGLWGLPTPVLKAVSLHHKPQLANDPGFTTLWAVHAADVFCGADGNHSLFATNRFDPAALAKLNLAGPPDLWKQAAENPHAG